MDDIKRPSKPPRNIIEDALRGKPVFHEAEYMPVLNKQTLEGNHQPLTSNLQKRGSKFKYKNFMRTLILGLGIVLAALAVVIGGMLVFDRLSSSALGPQDVIARVGKLVALPPGETPTVATVTDLAPLKGQAFFADARVGDKVLKYREEAVLYRPSENRVILVLPLSGN